MFQFEIWYADLPFIEGSNIIHGRRPVVIISNNTVNEHSPLITVIPMTSKIRRLDLPTHILVHGFGLRLDSMALCE